MAIAFSKLPSCVPRARTGLGNFSMRPKAETFQSRSAFSIVEVLVSVAVLTLLGTGGIAGLLSINRLVVSNRLTTNAQALAQSRLDRILAEPYPAGAPPPAELTVGTSAQTGVPIYTDPLSNNVIVAGTISTGSIRYSFDYDGDNMDGPASTDKAVTLSGIAAGSGEGGVTRGLLTRS